MNALHSKTFQHTIILLFVLFPIAALPFAQQTGSMFRTTTDIYGMLLILLTGGILLLPKKEIKINAADILFGCFLVYSCFNSLSTFDLLVILKNISLMLAYVAFRLFPKKAIVGLLVVILLTSLVQSVYGILQYLHFAKSLHPLFRLTGSFLNPAGLSFLLSIGATISAGLLLFPPFGNKTVLRVVLAIVTVWLLFVLVLTESRAAWVGTFLSVSFLLYWRYAPAIIRWQLSKAVKFTCAAIIFCLFCIGCYALYHFKKDSADGRLLIWKISAQMIAEQPITGNGSGAFRADYLFAQAAYFAERPDSPARLLADNSVHPFNEFLRIWYEQGLIGLFLLVVAAFLTVRNNRPPARICNPCLIKTDTGHRPAPAEGKEETDRSLSSFRSFVLPSLKAILIAGAVMCFFSYPLELWTIKIYLLIALALLAKELKPIRSTHRVLTAKSIYALFWCVTVSMTLFYSSHVHKSIEAGQERDLQTVASSYTVLRNNVEYISLYARVLRREGKYEEALVQMKALSQLSPSSRLFVDIGNLHLQKSRYDDAERHYWMARHMVPARFVPLRQLMALYIKTGQIEKAIKVAETIIHQPVKVRSTATDRIIREANDFLSQQSKINNKQDN